MMTPEMWGRIGLMQDEADVEWERLALAERKAAAFDALLERFLPWVWDEKKTYAVTLDICGKCLNGGGECHTPDCAMRVREDLPIPGMVRVLQGGRR